MFQSDVCGWGQGLGADRKWWVWKQSHDTGTLTSFHTSERNFVISSSFPPAGDHTEFLRFAQQAPLSAAILSSPALFSETGFLGRKSWPGFHPVAQASLELFMPLSQFLKYQDDRFGLPCLGTENHFCSSGLSGGRT